MNNRLKFTADLQSPRFLAGRYQSMSALYHRNLMEALAAGDVEAAIGWQRGHATRSSEARRELFQHLDERRKGVSVW